MGNHRAPRRGTRIATPSSEVTPQSPAPSVAGKRKAVKHAAPRGPLFRGLPSAPVLLGVAALSISATGAVSASGAGADEEQVPLQLAAQANALSGISAVSSTSSTTEREEAVSRDSRRDAAQDASEDKLQAAADAQAQQRNAELAKLAQSAQQQAEKIALNLWHLPVTNYEISARFGQSGAMWSRDHTGLDFNTYQGAPVMSVTNGVVTSVGWAGPYGQQIVITTEDGEELWYCHLSGYAVQEGDTVRGGQVIGYVGSTGNSTGSHLHLEVHPGAGDAVDPYQAFVAHGVTP